ncbi:MAG: hypothetical protein DMF63_05600 [Acidobacteria bacterium]|nr:MAG: hypothetical protein DMF63_05600 [Acidobacteriota bacterium]
MLTPSALIEKEYWRADGRASNALGSLMRFATTPFKGVATLKRFVRGKIVWSLRTYCRID